MTKRQREYQSNLEKYRRDALVWYRANRERGILARREYYRANKAAILAKRKAKLASPEEREKRAASRLLNRAKDAVAERAYRLKNAERIKEKKRQYRQKNAEKILAYQRKWQSENRMRLRGWDRSAYNDSPAHRLSKLIRNRIADCLKGRKQKLHIAVGCTVDELRKHIESTFKHGMSWENHGDWHIDHILPLASAGADEESILKAFHWSNMRAEWGIENKRKSARLTADSIRVAANLGISRLLKLRFAVSGDVAALAEAAGIIIVPP